MAIEIRELVIKATVSQDGKGGKGKPAVKPMDKDDIINDCVHQVMEILKQQKER